MLWASTSTKDPSYPDLMYVEPLIGPMTVNTMTRKTIAAFRDHDTVEDTIEQGLPAARRIMENLEGLGIRFDLVAAQLENEAVQKFIDPYDSLLGELAARQRRAVAFPDLDKLRAAAETGDPHDDAGGVGSPDLLRVVRRHRGGAVLS
jgi:transketolase